jgi:NADH-quinone oxidoreductase subunit G
VNGNEIELDDRERLNGIQAAQRLGIEIPHYCWHPGLSVVASCRMCLVEAGRRDPKTGEISMLPKLVPACQTPATDGAVFVTDSEKVRAARAMVEEDLLLRHPIDCPICDKAGECLLQDYHFQHGQEARRADIKPFTSRRRPVGSNVTLFVDRCIMCTRCVRFTREITDTRELMVVNRGSHEEIDVFPGFPLDNNMSGNVVDLCPVGALGDTDFLYQQRVWFMKRHAAICAGCSTGCSIFIDENQDRIYRIKPRENPHVNQWWICDEGRYGFHHVHEERRVVEPRRREGQAHGNIQWSEVAGELDARLREAGRLAAVFSPHLTVEEAYLLAQYVRSIDAQALLAVGPVPRREEDHKLPGGFTIHAEKCPNRVGIETIVAGVSGQLLTWGDLLAQVGPTGVQAIWLSGGYTSPWNDESTVGALRPVPLVIVQDLFPTPVWDQATYQLPGAAFAEREGSYVNVQHRLQSQKWAIRPPAGVMVEGHLYWQLAGRSGMYNARQVLDEVSRELVEFAAAAEPVPEHGVDLRVNRLA